MELQTPQDVPQSSSPAEVALSLNRELAARVKRWKHVRLTVTLVLGAMGVALFFVNSGAAFSVPVLLAAFLALLLYLDARDQLREVNARRWQFPTPRISRLKAPKDQPAQKPATP